MALMGFLSDPILDLPGAETPSCGSEGGVPLHTERRAW
jgi:hypothetical protein